jgi:hypothetical protein
LGEEAAAEAVAGAGVEGTLRIIGAGCVEVSAGADRVGGRAVAVYAVLALAVIGACLAKLEGVGWGGDLGVDGQREAGEEEGGLEHDYCYV